MSLTIGSNIASLKAQRGIKSAATELASVYERLSSGMRINRASDDAAGLAVADDLSANARIFSQGVRNLNDGISLLNVADSALENLSDIVMRLEELATQSANGVYGYQQRKALDAEAQALRKEFLRITRVTEFNGQKLLTGENPAVALQAGIGNDAILNASVGGAIGTGSFDASTSYTTASTSTNQIELGDLNGDGILDLVATGHDGGSGQVTVRLGAGNGTFGSSRSYAAEGLRSYDLSLGDINGDGILDLVTAGYDSTNGRTTVRLGVGDGTFGSATSFINQDVFTRAVTLGDINGDGMLDLVTARYGATARLGNGNGTFRSGILYDTEQGGPSYAVTLGDLNGDGKLDLLSAGSNDATGQGGVTVRLGNGNGTFRADTQYSSDIVQTNALTLGDLNGDGILDLVTGGSSLGGRVTVRLGTSSGTFGSATNYASEATNTYAVDLGDLNGDGVLDLISTGTGGGQGVTTVRMGTGYGTFGAATSYAMDATSSLGVSAGDLNNDGTLDLATAGSGGGQGRETVRLSQTVEGVAPLLEFSLATTADARQALPVFKNKLQQLANQRGQIGAMQSRIGFASNLLTSSSENYRAAEARIRDADIAEESSRLMRLSILQQASSAILAQANQQPALVLRLLGG